jgi:hypothetical protein
LSANASALLKPYYFFLFTDLLVYASAGGQPLSVYKFKHAFHLSLLSLAPAGESAAEREAVSLVEDEVGMFPFTFLTPQAAETTPLFLAAPDAQTRREWIEAVQAQKQILRQRQLACAALQSVPRSKRLSRFVGAPFALDLDVELENSVVHPTHHCRLCLRTYNALFRRTAQCLWCAALICSACCQRRVRLPSHLLAQCSVQREQQAQATAAPAAVQETVAAARTSPSPDPLSSPPPPSSSSSSSSSSARAHAASAFVAGSSFLSKLNRSAVAGVSSMHRQLRSAMARLNEREGVAVCDACIQAVHREVARPAMAPLPPTAMQQRTRENSASQSDNER